LVNFITYDLAKSDHIRRFFLYNIFFPNQEFVHPGIGKSGGAALAIFGFSIRGFDYLQSFVSKNFLSADFPLIIFPIIHGFSY
jgi:hypothetical protein